MSISPPPIATILYTIHCNTLHVAGCAYEDEPVASEEDLSIRRSEMVVVSAIREEEGVDPLL